MTVTIKEHINEYTYISLEIKNQWGMSYYEVQACQMYSDGTCGNPFINMIYSMDEKEKALATFNRYKRKYT